MDGEAPREGRNKAGSQKQSKKNLIFLSYNFSLTIRPVKGFPQKAKKFNDKVRRFAPHFTALS